MDDKPKAPRKPKAAPQNREYEEIQRDGNLQVTFKVQKGDRVQGWKFAALTPADAVEFAEDICNQHEFRFRRDAIEWEFEQQEG